MNATPAKAAFELQSTSHKSELLTPIGAVLIVGIVWEITFRHGAIDLTFFPPPSQFVTELIRDKFQVTAGLERADILVALTASLFRVMVGIFISFVLGLATGMLVTQSRTASSIILPLVRLIAPIAPLAWVPLAIILFGATQSTAIFIVVLGTYPMLAIAATASVQQIPREQLDVAATLGASKTQIWRLVVFPSILPNVFLMMRLNQIAAWMALLAGESVSLRNGLGGIVIVGREAVSPNMVMAGVALIAIAGFTIDLLLMMAQKYLLPYRRPLAL